MFTTCIYLFFQSAAIFYVLETNLILNANLLTDLPRFEKKHDTPKIKSDFLVGYIKIRVSTFLLLRRDLDSNDNRIYV